MNHRWKPVREPLHVCDRWISAARVRRKANFLAFGPMQNLHGCFPRVRFGPVHARNLAEDALRAGFLDSEICAAYRVGLEETQVSATRDWHDDGNAPPQREPSQAVARAWLRLRTDGRTDEQRWAAIFAGADAPQKSFPLSVHGSPVPETKPETANREPSPGRARPFVQLAPGLRVRSAESAAELAKKREVDAWSTATPGLVKAATRTKAQFAAGGISTLEQYLAHRGLTLPDLLKRSRAEQQAFVRELAAWQKSEKPGR